MEACWLLLKGSDRGSIAPPGGPEGREEETSYSCLLVNERERKKKGPFSNFSSDSSWKKKRKVSRFNYLLAFL